MINLLRIKQFKCFKDLALPLANLTLLSGTNASGKSSVLQALVLLQQTMREHEWSTHLMLNGESVKLGTVDDVVDKVHGRDRIDFDIEAAGFSCGWSFKSDERTEMSMAVDQIRVNGAAIPRPKMLQFLLPYSAEKGPTPVALKVCGLTYITAERVGPREFYSLEDRQVATVVGPAGEHALSLLYADGEEAVLDGLRLADVPPTRLRQVEARMNQFFPGCSMSIVRVRQTNAVTLGLRTSDDTNYHRPVHVGFGLTQVLPIVIAILSAAEGDIILIENPEVHLHPKGQAQMGQFLAGAANAGVQVIVETHSDHVFNGIRRAVKVGMSPDKVALHFFAPRTNGKAQVTSPQLDAKGNIDHWPEGFFDQFDKDMNYFAGWED